MRDMSAEGGMEFLSETSWLRMGVDSESACLNTAGGAIFQSILSAWRMESMTLHSVAEKSGISPTWLTRSKPPVFSRTAMIRLVRDGSILNARAS